MPPVIDQPTFVKGNVTRAQIRRAGGTAYTEFVVGTDNVYVSGTGAVARETDPIADSRGFGSVRRTTRSAWQFDLVFKWDSGPNDTSVTEPLFGLPVGKYDVIMDVFGSAQGDTRVTCAASADITDNIATGEQTFNVSFFSDGPITEEAIA